jgi:hypothetical protein
MPAGPTPPNGIVSINIDRPTAKRQFADEAVDGLLRSTEDEGRQRNARRKTAAICFEAAAGLPPTMAGEESGLEAGSDGGTMATNGASEVVECCWHRDSQKPLGARR